MKPTGTNRELKLPNMLLVAGNGRNVGKTWFSCRAIKHLAKSTKVSAIKISAHFHPFNEIELIAKNERFVIIEEKQINTKDSSLMLQAGAQKVYFIMAAQENLNEAFSQLQALLPNHAIVCESGGLHQMLTPGLFFFINQKEKKIVKEHHLNYSPIRVTNDGVNIDFDIKRISFQNGKIVLNPQTKIYDK